MKLVIHEPQWSRYADRLRSLAGAHWNVVCTRDTASLRSELADADALLALELQRECIESARRLRLFLFPGAGPLRTAPEDYPRGCAVATVSEHGAPIAEYVMAAILGHVTGLCRYAAAFRQGSWEGSGRTGGHPHDEAFGKTVGLVGYGTIGQAVAARAKAFGMHVMAICRNPKGASDVIGGAEGLSLLLTASDFLVIAAPLTDATRGMIGGAELQRMKPTAVLINVSRAEIVNEDALYSALREAEDSGRGAGCLVPVSDTSGRTNPRLFLVVGRATARTGNCPLVRIRRFVLQQLRQRGSSGLVTTASRSSRPLLRRS